MKYYVESSSKGASYVQENERRIIRVGRRNCLLQYAIKGKIEWMNEWYLGSSSSGSEAPRLKGKIEGRREVKGSRGRRCKQLLVDLKETRRYWKLKEEALHWTAWRSRYGPVLGQTAEWMTKVWLIHCATISSGRFFNNIEHLLIKRHVVTHP